MPTSPVSARGDSSHSPRTAWPPAPTWALSPSASRRCSSTRTARSPWRRWCSPRRSPSCPSSCPSGPVWREAGRPRWRQPWCSSGGCCCAPWRTPPRSVRSSADRTAYRTADRTWRRTADRTWRRTADRTWRRTGPRSRRPGAPATRAALGRRRQLARADLRRRGRGGPGHVPVRRAAVAGSRVRGHLAAPRGGAAQLPRRGGVVAGRVRAPWMSTLVFTAGIVLAGLVNAVLIGRLTRRIGARRPAAETPRRRTTGPATPVRPR